MTQQVAVIIVTFNSQAEIASCLESVRSLAAEVVVIDNASSDATVAIAVDLGFKVIANRSNRGFAAAVNQGVRATEAPYLLLLNPDAALQTNVDALVRQCSIPGVGAAGGRLVTADGKNQKGFNVRRFPSPLALFFETVLLNRVWPGNPVNWRYRCLDLDLAKPSEVDQPAGAFLMFTREICYKLGGFDEGFYPIWFEDVDFCKRVHDAGLRLFYCPDAIARHTGAHSIVQVPLGNRTEYWYGSLLRYSIQHFSTAGRMLACLGVITGSILRLFLGGSSHRTRAMLQSYRRVVRAAFQSMRIERLQLGEWTS